MVKFRAFMGAPAIKYVEEKNAAGEVCGASPVAQVKMSSAIEDPHELCEQCVGAGVPFFLKNLGKRPGKERELDGRTWEQVPGRQT